MFVDNKKEGWGGEVAEEKLRRSLRSGRDLAGVGGEAAVSANTSQPVATAKTGQ